MCNIFFLEPNRPYQANKTSFIFLWAIYLITMPFPIFIKNMDKYNCTEKLFKHDMQPHQAIDLELQSSSNFIS